MVINLTKDEVERTKDLAEAIRSFFGLNLEGRLCVLDSEVMEGNVAEAYNQLGLNVRKGTYKKIVIDFKTRTDYSDVVLSEEGVVEKRNLILDVGCGSGLLSFELAEQTKGIILGIDASKDMIRLANQNKEKKAEEFVQRVIQDYQSGGYDFSRPIPAACDPMLDIVDSAHSDLRRIIFGEGSAYDLSDFLGKERCADYIVCRNVLHRLKEPEKALEQMLKVLRVGGKIYLRDLKRDADWQTIIERIGEQRWANPVLVKDYIGAMASMLTTEELENMLISNGIKDYKITDGSYRNGNEPLPKGNIREFEKDTEYVCIIKKTSDGK
jgi:2-polyprenyl-3-methyl-5-hydroxy-6-metoxy-1,4-benzoquinol methylase